MINKKDFYSTTDEPTQEEQREVWAGVRRDISGAKRPLFFIRDRASFFYGIAAAIVFVFFSAGVWMVFGGLVENSLTPEAKLEMAYRNVLTEFDRVLATPPVIETPNDTEKSLFTLRREQLRALDEATELLRSEMKNSPNDAALRGRLFQLYGLKIQFLQQLLMPPVRDESGFAVARGKE